MKLWVSAFEQSSDQYLAGVLEELKRLNPELEIRGIGGASSRRAGLKTLFHAEELSIMGLAEIISALPKVFSRLAQIKKDLRKNPPDVALLIDYPGLHFALLPTLKKLGTRVVYFIPPKVWVWRKSRIQKLRKYVDRVLCIFPFEKEFFEEEGLEVDYVGNPLLDQLPLALTKEEARSKLGLSPSDQVLLVMPGSRKQEIEFHLELMANAAQKIKRNANFVIYFSFPNRFDDEQKKKWLDRLRTAAPEAKVGFGDSHLAMRAADYGLIKSGTSTLEAALLGLRHVVVYRLSAVTCFILRKVLRLKGHAGFSNLILDVKGERPGTFEERLCSDASEEELISALEPLIHSDTVRKNQVGALSEIKSRMLIKGSPTEHVARAVVSELAIGRSKIYKFSLVKWVAAHVWSVIHQGRKLFSQPKKINPQVISVGNFQMGGSGKTPFVLELLREAKRKGKKVWVLTRGYRSQSEQLGTALLPGMPEPNSKVYGDEALLIRSQFPEVPIGIGKNRYKSYQRLFSILKEEPDWVILDDGGQNLQLKKDLDIFLVTSKRVGETWYREIPKITSSQNQFLIWSKGKTKPSFLGEDKNSLARVRLETRVKGELPENEIYLVSAIAEPTELRQSLESLGMRISAHKVYEDHEPWSDYEIAAFLSEAKENQATLVMTAKDFARVPDRMKNSGILVVDTTVMWIQGKERWEGLLK